MKIRMCAKVINWDRQNPYSTSFLLADVKAKANGVHTNINNRRYLTYLWECSLAGLT